jgi:hypothetical protein
MLPKSCFQPSQGKNYDNFLERREILWTSTRKTGRSMNLHDSTQLSAAQSVGHLRVPNIKPIGQCMHNGSRKRHNVYCPLSSHIRTGGKSLFVWVMAKGLRGRGWCGFVGLHAIADDRYLLKCSRKYLSPSIFVYLLLAAMYLNLDGNNLSMHNRHGLAHYPAGIPAMPIGIIRTYYLRHIKSVVIYLYMYIRNLLPKKRLAFKCSQNSHMFGQFIQRIFCVPTIWICSQCVAA